MILRVHLVPALGERRLDAIKNEEVQRLKSRLSAKSPKTVNNVLAVLSVLLKKGVEWEGTSFDTRSARTWPCAALQSAPSRSWPDTGT